jgi:hypothetical protein
MDDVPIARELRGQDSRGKRAGSRKEIAEVKVHLTHVPAPDAELRLLRAVDLLLRSSERPTDSRGKQEPEENASKHDKVALEDNEGLS